MKIVRIGAMWCPGCLVMNPRFKALEEAFPNIEYIKLDYDIDEDEVQKLNVGSILPVIIIYNIHGKEIKRIIGEIKKEDLLNIVGELYEKN